MDSGQLVIVETPYAGDIDINVKFARKCIKDCLERGEYPFASHLLYTQEGVLDDENPEERMWRINSGLAWASKADKTVVYIDLGISKGMHYGMLDAIKHGRPIEIRVLNMELL